MGQLTSMPKLTDRAVNDEFARTLNTKQKRHVTSTHFAEKYSVYAFFSEFPRILLYIIALKLYPPPQFLVINVPKNHGLV